MSGRDVTKVFCPRNHRVGTVVADADGLLVDYSALVLHRDGMFGADSANRLRDDAADVFEAYCKSCRKPVQLDARQLRSAAKAGQRDIVQPYGDTLDAVWVDAGRTPMYPPGTTRHKRDPR